MTNRVQVLRSSVAGNVPTAGTRSPGELWTNFVDLTLGHINASQQPVRLLGVRYFSASAAYVAGDLVAQGGAIYSALGSVPAGAFTPSQWNRLAMMSDVTGAYVPIAGGTMTGALILNADPSAALGAATKQYVDSHVTGFLPTSGGTMTGPLTLTGNLTMTSTGTLTINPTTPGHIDNTIIGGSVAAAGTFTNLNASNVNFTGGTIGAGVTITGVPAPGTTVPLMDSGAGAAGGGLNYARSDHVHPSDTSRAGLATANTFSGGNTFSGAGGVLINSTAANPTFQLASTGLISGGMQVYSAGMAPGSAYGSYNVGAFDLYNVALRSCYYVGPLGSTPNQFGATPSYIWGSAHWGYPGGGGGLYGRSDNTGTYMAGWLWGTSSLVGTISTNGSTVSYNTSSDGRLKQRIRDLTDDLDPGALIDAIRPVAFEWRNRKHNSFEPGTSLVAEDLDDDSRSRTGREIMAKGSSLGHGFIAQELVRVAPFAVHAPADDDGERNIEFDFEKGVHPWGVDFSKLVPYLVAELQLLRRRVAQLEGR